jgi:nicotinate-nucleotide adenylyltransferase
MKIGLYGGTFDPIHHGHLILARQALEQLGLDRLVFIPAAQSPFKTDQALTAGRHRFEMVKLAIEGEAYFAVDDLEIERTGPSYSIDTVNIYRQGFPGADLFWLIGEDHVPSLPKWHRIDDLKDRVRFVVLSRADWASAGPYPVIPRRIDISATEIRNRVANNLPITYLVPERVLRYVQAVKLYRGEEHRS